MSAERSLYRLRDVAVAISEIDRMLAGRGVDQLKADSQLLAAFKWQLLTISEASRHLPAEWKDELGTEIPWRRVADLGNELRHGYHRLDTLVLWEIYTDDLPALRAAIDAMIERYGPIP